MFSSTLVASEHPVSFISTRVNTLRNELFSELTRLSAVEHSFATAYSKEENGIVERANQEVMCHLRVMLFDARVHDK